MHIYIIFIQFLAAQSHYSGKNHRKKLKQALKLLKQPHAKRRQDSASGSAGPDSHPSRTKKKIVLEGFFNQQIFESGINPANLTYCVLCDVSLTSYITAQAHYAGKSHAKKYNAWLMSNPVENPIQGLKPEMFATDEDSFKK